MTKKHSKPISLYPLSPDDALRAALQTSPEKIHTIRSKLESKDKTELFKEEPEGKSKARRRRGKVTD
jgi:hypothetical protein